MAKVLIVDDSPFMVRLVGYMLETAGYETASAENGKVALELIAQDPPDLVFLDMMMPEMNGLETLRAIRADAKTKDLPVLMLSAKAQTQDCEAAKEIGADGYLIKPFKSAQVLDSAAQYLGPPPDKQRGTG